MLTLCLLGYAGFFRFNELVQLRRCDFQFEDSFMRVFVHRSKTDVYRDGAWVVIAKTFKHTCPYLLVQRYFVAASFSADSEEFIFRPVVFLRSTGTYKLRGSVPLSYTRARESGCLALSIPSVFPSKTTVSIALGPEVPPLLLMLECLTDCLKDTAVGNQTRQKTVTLRIVFIHCCRFRYHWVFNFPYFPFF